MAFLKISKAFATFALLSILLTVIAPSLAQAETSPLAKFKGVWVVKDTVVVMVTVSKTPDGWKVTAQNDEDAVVDEVNAYHLLVHSTTRNGTIQNYYSLALTGDDSAMEEFYQTNNGQRSAMMEQHMNLVRKPQ